MSLQLQLHGVITATVLPFKFDGSIDWHSYHKLLEYCAAPEDISAIFVNGHAGEGATLDAEEREDVITATRKFLQGTDKPLLAGVIPYSTQSAVHQARAAESSGADVLVLFPMPQFSAGGAISHDAPLAYVREVASQTSIPISIFQYPLKSGLGYSTETLIALADIPQVIAIKEGSDDIMAYEENWRKIKEAAPNVAVLASNFDWFLAQCSIGTDGILSGLASLAPDILIDLWCATKKGDLDAMRSISDRLYHLVRSIYGTPPRMDMHTRIKEALVAIGVIDCARPRPPLLSVSREVTNHIHAALIKVDFLRPEKSEA
ncbi:MAG TPA: dihydrodipicolinate synthase family protein [Alphaproteobacteria bacterium]|jgi:4-hydroxy-tetrahydrodipicolinate synthase|nr:dihydrodipicolinate synthase family protein [Alphaproteobacteria bacterium]